MILFKISDAARFVTYADSTSIFLTDSNPDDTRIASNKEMSLLKLWVDINPLKINTNKTKAISFAPVNKLLSLSVKLELDDNQIEFVNAVTSLRVMFSSHLG